MLFRPSESSKKIVDFYRRYLLTTFRTNDESYNEQLEAELKKKKAIADGPYISMSAPYKKGKSLVELAQEEKVTKELLKIKGFVPNRKLYKHQEEAVIKANEGKNLIVTTGTGSGKTESFLIPIINQLLREKEEGTLGPGVRTLIIYPMNALVNDQIRRIRELLKDMDSETKITFGRFTGETEEEYEKAKIKYEEVEDVEKDPLMENELISREQMRRTPPNILITNYAMLEYMLLRPGDNIIFSKENAEKWQYIVFDEAHSYVGAKGIEVATMIKRVKAMLNRDDIKFILTSATLGDEKSNDEIIHFGEQLCNAHFDASCIVRSYPEIVKPEREVKNIKFDVYEELAGKIRDNESEERMLEVLRKYDVEIDETKSFPEVLFEMILHDQFYYEVRSALYDQIKTIDVLAEELYITVENLTDFIAVASNAVRNGEKLFEAKYHMFLRGLEGVYITLNPSKKLFINKMESYVNPLTGDEEKVFETTFCNNCGSLFIRGILENGRLVQKRKYEDYEEPNIYLLGSTYDEDVEDDEKAKKEYWLCSRCGAIAKNLKCGCGETYKNKVMLVKDRGDKLNKCPCCHSFNAKRSILRPYYLGSEAATAVIATALYNELPDVKKTIEVKKITDSFFGNSTSINEKIEKLTKQFIAFSDSRQMAAFFASYLNTSYRDTLVKRIMYEIVSEKNDKFENGVSLKSFVGFLTQKMIKYNLFGDKKNEEEVEKEAWIYTLKEISNYKAKNSMQNEGILMFDIDINVPELPHFNLNKEETSLLFKIFVKDMMKDSAIDTPEVSLDADIKRFSITGFKRGYRLKSVKNASIIGWAPENSKTNKRLKFIKQISEDSDASDDECRKLLEAMWEEILNNEGFLVDGRVGKGKNSDSVSFLNPDKIKVKSVNRLFRCNECNSITPYNIKGKCNNPSCNGRLEEYYYKDKLKGDHYYNLYANLNITPMIVNEHTAQLSSKTAYDYQRQFKDGEINVLSCSTTFEMGVDVGSLETVFMRNMPPSPANYAQRAGRAGRSLQSAAYAITYCPNSSHDLNYYRNPKEMIKGTIRPPYFNTNNSKIVLRHIFASAFSFFWKEYSDLYTKTIDEFMKVKGFDKMKEYLKSKPVELKAYIDKILGNKELKEFFGVDNFLWVKELFSEDGKDGLCDIAINDYESRIKEMEKEEQYLRNNKGKGYNIDKIMKSIKTIKDQGMIEFLSKSNLIPKYGFPVDTVELQSSNTNISEEISLSRDLFSAISEYAPDSEIVANGKLLKSRYVRKLAGYEWPRNEYVRCKNCLTMNTWQHAKNNKECFICGEPFVTKTKSYIIPKFGFIMDINKAEDAGINKPIRTYKGSVSYIGDTNNIKFREFLFANKRVYIGNSKMDKLLILNESNFYICNTCGYGKVINDTYDDFIEEKIKHKDANGYYCSNKKLEHLSLGHELQTDVAFLKFIDIDINKDMQNDAWTILYSLLEGLSKTINIDRNELSGCLQWYKDNEHPKGNYGFVLFDNTPGGAGYVRQLDKPHVFLTMMKEAYRVVKQCNCGGKKADTACYSCLCNYYNQNQHDILKRRYAIEFFENFLEGATDKWDIEDQGIISGFELTQDLDYFEELNSVEKEDYYKISFCNIGTNMSSESMEYIWGCLMEDCEYDNEKNIIDQLANSYVKKIEKPIYGEDIEIIETGKRMPVDLIWKASKVMLFLNEGYEDYLEAKKTGWSCYCTKEKFDINEFLEKIEV